MTGQMLENICRVCFGQIPERMERRTQSIGNYVYRVVWEHGLFNSLWQEWINL